MSLMVRLFVAAIVLSCLSTSASTQTPPAPPTSGTQSTKSPVKPTTRKPAERTDPAASAKIEPCGIGIIVAVGDEFMVKRIGLDFFNDHVKFVPIESWGLGDLVFARVRAAIPRAVAVRRIPYSKSVKP